MSISSWWLLCNSGWLRWGNFCFRALENGKVVILLRVCLFGFLCLIIKHSFDSLHFFPSLILYIPKELCLLHSGQDRLCFSVVCLCARTCVAYAHMEAGAKMWASMFVCRDQRTTLGILSCCLLPYCLETGFLTESGAVSRGVCLTMPNCLCGC